MCLLCQDNGMKQRPGVENLEECLYFIFIGGQHLNASWSHDGRCLLNAICVCVCACVKPFQMSRMFCLCASSSVCNECLRNVQICQVEGFGSKNQRCRLLWPSLRIGFAKRYAGHFSQSGRRRPLKERKAGFSITAVCLAQLRMQRSFLAQIIWMP